MTARTLALAATLVVVLVAAPAHAESARVAVLPVVVHSFDGRDYLQAGLADMLSARLEQVPGIRVVRVRDAATATTDTDAARDTAGAHGAAYVLYGSYTQFGEGASLDLHCARVAPGARDDDAGASRAVFIQSGAPGEIIPQLEDVAEKVARYVLAGPERVSSPPGDAPAPSEADDLRQRVEALERAVFEHRAEEVPEVDLRSEALLDPTAP